MARHKFEIEYTSGADVFKVVLTSNSPDVFSQVKKNPDTKDKEGEALVSALLSQAKGGIFRVERYKDGQLNDGPKGEYAMEGTDDSGARIASHYKNGKRHNGANGEPAFQKFHDNGTRVYAVFYDNDKRQDGPKGEPAEQVSDEKGKFVYVARFNDDKRTKIFTPEEIAQYQPKTSTKAKPKTPKPGM